MRNGIKRFFIIMLTLAVAFTLIPNFDFSGGVNVYAEENSNVTGFIKDKEGKWIFVRSGVKDPTYTGLAKVVGSEEVYFATNGDFNPKYTGFYTFRGTLYGVVNGKIDLGFTGVVPSEKGGWYFVRKGVYDPSYTGLAREANSNNIRYVKEGVFRKYTGIYKFNGTYYAVRNGIVDMKFTGVVPNEKGGWNFTRKGVYDTSYSGLAKRVDNSKLYYVTKGVFDKKYTGHVKYFDDFYGVINGAVDYNFTGIIKNKHNGKWYFVRKGKFDTSYSGLAKRVDNNKLYYVTKGVLDESYTGHVKYFDDFYGVINGAVDYNFTGIIKNKHNGKWYFVRKGKYDTSYSGLAKRVDNNKLYYVTNGVFDEKYTGHVKYFDDFYGVINGAVDYNYTGILKNKHNGKWYFVRKGKYDPSYSGLAERFDNKKLYYVTKGVLDEKYTGHVKYFDKFYGVRNGTVDYNYTGILKNKHNNKWYFIRKGVYDNTYTGLTETDGDYFYVVNGAYRDDYSGPAQKEGDDTWYHVGNGWVDTSYTGSFYDGTNDYTVKKGIIVNSRVNYKGKRFYVGKDGVEGQDPYTRPPKSSRSNPSVIEVSISQQHMWYYEYGEVIISTDVITGNPNAGRLATPVGWDYVHSKSRDIRLVGSDYNVHVDYWIGIDSTGYYGIHDASWRNGVFGGNIYTYSPSHGCVNTPYYAMKQLYSEVSTGYTDVYVYW